jgi:hypothetical protein
LCEIDQNSKDKAKAAVEGAWPRSSDSFDGTSMPMVPLRGQVDLPYGEEYGFGSNLVFPRPVVRFQGTEHWQGLGEPRLRISVKLGNAKSIKTVYGTATPRP